MLRVKFARVLEWRRCGYLRDRDPWKFCEPSTMCNRNHIELASGYLVRAYEACGKRGALPHGFRLQSGWGEVDIVSTIMAAGALRAAGEFLKCQKLTGYSEQANSFLAQTLETIPHRELSSSELTHLILHFSHFPDRMSLLGLGNELRNRPSSSAKAIDLAPDVMVQLALFRVGFDDEMCRQGAEMRNKTFAELCMESVAYIELYKATNSPEAFRMCHDVVEFLMLRFERRKSLAERTGSEGVRPIYPGACAAFSTVLWQFSELFPDPRFLNAALKMNEYLKNAHLSGWVPPEVNGGLRGCDPLFYGDLAYSFPVWSTRFLLQALIQEEVSLGE
ncbi:MAG: hypothetical protein CL484_03845 [Acidobacteria bacterium]|nr:hypothetical protein [Acidobacteriota bacterium]